MLRLRALVFAALLIAPLPLAAQSTPEETKPAAAAPAPAEPPKKQADDLAEKPLPEPGKIIALARSHFDAWGAIEKDYICKQTVVADNFDSHGNKKGTDTDEYRVFFVHRTEIHQHITHNGKPLSPSDEKKEQERVDKAVAKAKSAEEKKPDAVPPPRLAMLLKVTTLSGERRETINGRSTIIFDYTGNPKAKADNITEEIMKRLSGHIWIDEEDAATARIEGVLNDNFHIAGGLLVNVKKGAHFVIENTRVNGEIWFMHTLEAHADGHILLFKGFDGNEHVTFSDYRKLKTTITIQPGVRVLDENGNPLPDVVDETPATPKA